jgi:hypothetical protein
VLAVSRGVEAKLGAGRLLEAARPYAHEEAKEKG